MGELAALTRRDVDESTGWIAVRKSQVELADGSLLVGAPKTTAGRRRVAIPSALLPEVRAHLAGFVAPGEDVALFAGSKGAPLRRSGFQRHWTTAVAELRLVGVHFHDLRHTGNTLTAQSGATLPDVMARMGHASPRAALIYLHTNSTRDRVVADALNRLLPGKNAG